MQPSAIDVDLCKLPNDYYARERVYLLLSTLIREESRLVLSCVTSIAKLVLLPLSLVEAEKSRLGKTG